MTKTLAMTIMVIVVSLFLGGCGSSVKQMTVTSNPPNAFIRLDQTNLGSAPVNASLDFGEKKSMLVTAELEGYYTEEVMVQKNSNSVENGILTLNLKENPVFKSTTENRATNTWISVQVRDGVTQEDMWQIIVDSVTSSYDVLEQMDSASGYIRSLAKVRTFTTNNGTLEMRTQFIGKISDQDPLTYRMKVVSETRNSTVSGWRPYSRIFKDDAIMIEELNSRLAIR